MTMSLFFISSMAISISLPSLTTLALFGESFISSSNAFLALPIVSLSRYSAMSMKKAITAEERNSPIIAAATTPSVIKTSAVIAFAFKSIIVFLTNG